MKRYVFAAVSITVFVLGLIVWNASSSDISDPLSESEMRVEYRCDRVTADYLETDVYCSDYSTYVQDFKNGSLIVN